MAPIMAPFGFYGSFWTVHHKDDIVSWTKGHIPPPFIDFIDHFPTPSQPITALINQ